MACMDQQSPVGKTHTRYATQTRTRAQEQLENRSLIVFRALITHGNTAGNIITPEYDSFVPIRARLICIPNGLLDRGAKKRWEMGRNTNTNRQSAMEGRVTGSRV